MFKIKQLFSALLVLCALSVFPTLSQAAGKIENATMEEVIYAINTTIERAEKSLELLNGGAPNEEVLDMLKETKQIHKEIEVTRLGPLKGRAASKMKKARNAMKKGDREKALKNVEAGIEYYYKLRKKFYDF